MSLDETRSENGPKIVTSRHWLILMLGCMLMFGNYYCYDIPAALNTPLYKWLGVEYDLYQWQINMLYSVYSFPNIVMPLVGGFLIDRLGPTVMLALFSTCVCAGQTLFAMGVLYKTFPVMIAGRSLFGLGGESLEVAQSLITTDWFKGRGLAFALSINLSFARIATALNDIASPRIEKIANVPTAVFVGFAVCLASFAAGILIIFFDRPTSRLAAGVHVDEAVLEKLRLQGVLGEEEEGLLDPRLSPDVDDASPSQSVRRRVRLNDTESSPPLIVTSEQDSSSMTTAFEDYDEEDEHVHVEQIKGMSGRFWILCLITITLYGTHVIVDSLLGSAVPFFHICTDFFQQKWYHDDSQTAGMVMSVPDIVSAIGSPICGWLVDKYGKRATLLPISAGLVFITHFIMCFTTISPFMSMSVLGVAYSVFPSALWPCVPYLVGRHQIATAYGLVTVSLNLALFLFPFAVAKIRSSFPSDFVPVQLFFMALSLVGLSFSLILLYMDKKQGGILDKGSAEDTLSTPEQHDDATSILSAESESSPLHRTGLSTDISHYSQYDETSDWVPKVVTEGHVILAPATYIHHHHQKPHPDGSDTTTQRTRQASCSCFINNGGLTSSPHVCRLKSRSPSPRR